MENVILSHVEYKSNMYLIVNAINVLFWIFVVWTKKKYALKFLESKEFGTDLSFWLNYPFKILQLQ